MTAGAGSRIWPLSLLVSGRVFCLLECLAPVPTIPKVQKTHVMCFIFVTMVNVGYIELGYPFT
jgi:hypothetical protein